jgi:hypothetical protein
LLDTRCAPERTLQRAIGSHTGVDLDHAVSASYDVDEGIEQFVYRAMMDDLLPDTDVLFHWFPETFLPHEHTD